MAKPKMILLQDQGRKNTPISRYFAEMVDRTDALQQSLAPYNDTIDRADKSIETIDAEIDACYERAATLEQQRLELEGVINDANKSRQKISQAHGDSIVEYNQSFFVQAAKDYKVPELADKSKSWDIDFAYYPTFGFVFITEHQAITNENIIPDDDEGGMSDWMDSVNN